MQDTIPEVACSYWRETRKTSVRTIGVGTKCKTGTFQVEIRSVVPWFNLPWKQTSHRNLLHIFIWDKHFKKRTSGLWDSALQAFSLLFSSNLCTSYLAWHCFPVCCVLINFGQDQHMEFIVAVIILNIEFQANMHGLKYILWKIIIFKSSSFLVSLEKLVAVAP